MKFTKESMLDARIRSTLLEKGVITPEESNEKDVVLLICKAFDNANSRRLREIKKIRAEKLITANLALEEKDEEIKELNNFIKNSMRKNNKKKTIKFEMPVNLF